METPHKTIYALIAGIPRTRAMETIEFVNRTLGGILRCPEDQTSLERLQESPHSHNMAVYLEVTRGGDIPFQFTEMELPFGRPDPDNEADVASQNANARVRVQRCSIQMSRARTIGLIGNTPTKLMLNMFLLDLNSHLDALGIPSNKVFAKIWFKPLRETKGSQMMQFIKLYADEDCARERKLALSRLDKWTSTPKHFHIKMWPTMKALIQNELTTRREKDYPCPAMFIDGIDAGASLQTLHEAITRALGENPPQFFVFGSKPTISNTMTIRINTAPSDIRLSHTG